MGQIHPKNKRRNRPSWPNPSKKENLEYKTEQQKFICSLNMKVAPLCSIDPPWEEKNLISLEGHQVNTEMHYVISILAFGYFLLKVWLDST